MKSWLFSFWKYAWVSIASLSSEVVERRTTTGSEPFCLLINLDANKFLLSSVLTLIRDDLPQKFVQNHGSAVRKVFFRLTCAAQKRGSRLKVLLKITTENGIYSHPMKVISNTILFVYSLRGALIKIARGCYTWWRNYFDGTTPLTAISTPWGRGWQVHQPTAWPVPNHPGVSRQLSRPRGVLIRDHQNMKYQQVHSDKPISMI